MRRGLKFSMAIVVCAAMGIAPSHSAADENSPLSPAIQTALTELSSADFATRKKARSDLEAALTEEAVALSSAKSEETRSELLKTLQFQQGLIGWMQNVLKLPPDQRDAELQLISNQSVVPILSQIFSPQPPARIDGLRALGKLAPSVSPAAGVDILLSHALMDPDRGVALAAMEVAWDRPPTDAVVDALWERAVQSSAIRSLQRIPPVHQEFSFRGQPLPALMAAPTSVVPTTDGDIAAQVLVHLQAPQMKERLTAFLQQAADPYSRTDAPVIELNSYSSQLPAVKNALILFQGYPSPAGFSAVYTMATGRQWQKYAYLEGARQRFASNRTNAIATLVTATGQQPDDYQLRQISRVIGNPVWVFPAEKDEEAAVTTLREWWAANGAKYTESAMAAPH